jgi:hypothetical protein
VVKYRNGYVPDSALVTVEDNDQLTEPAASAFLAMKADAAKAGITLSIVEPAGAYRSFFVQEDMHARPWLYNLNPANVVTLAKPGYSSHGFGDRFDCAAAALPWVLANGSRFGFTREFGAKDPNHFMHDGAVRGFGSGGAAPVPKRKKPPMSMAYLKTSTLKSGARTPDTLLALSVGGVWTEYRNGSPDGNGVDMAVRIYRSRGDAPALELNDSEWERTKADHARLPAGGTLPTDLARKSDVPTAAENGLAARAAIVKD